MKEGIEMRSSQICNCCSTALWDCYFVWQVGKNIDGLWIISGKPKNN